MRAIPTGPTNRVLFVAGLAARRTAGLFLRARRSAGMVFLLSLRATFRRHRIRPHPSLKLSGPFFTSTESFDHRFYVERNVGPDETRSRRLSFGREQLEEVATALTRRLKRCRHRTSTWWRETRQRTARFSRDQLMKRHTRRRVRKRDAAYQVEWHHPDEEGVAWSRRGRQNSRCYPGGSGMGTTTTGTFECCTISRLVLPSKSPGCCPGPSNQRR